METYFVIFTIVFSVLLLLGLVTTGISSFVCFKAVTKNFELQDKLQQYSKFFEILLETLQVDTVFLRSELARTIKGAENIPSYKELNSGFLQFENHLKALEQALREFKLID